MDQTLAGRVALVTGSSRRIGRSIALALAARGAAVVINARVDKTGADEVVAEARRRGGRADSCMADITIPDEAKRLVEFAVEKFGGLDILVNNAAVRRAVRFSDMTFQEWREIFAIVLDGAFLCSHAAHRHLAKNGHGRIINIGGITAHTGARDRAHVTAAKAGMVGLTKSLALDLAADGTTVNCVAPGVIEAEDDDAKVTQARRSSRPLSSIPLGRAGAPQDVAALVVALCGDEMAYITGQTLHVNGGVYMS